MGCDNHTIQWYEYAIMVMRKHAHDNIRPRHMLHRRARTLLLHGVNAEFETRRFLCRPPTWLHRVEIRLHDA